MGRMDPRFAHLHKQVYNELFDALDTEIAKEIMKNPSCEEAQLLNQHVEAEIRRRLDALQD